VRKAQFTPGPWHFTGFKNVVYGDPEAMRAEIPRILAQVPYSCQGRKALPEEQRYANGVLVASAPDMFAMLEELAGERYRPFLPPVVVERIEAVLIKAAGGRK
jgi:hypothetical protein